MLIGGALGTSSLTEAEAETLALIGERRPGFCAFGYQSLKLSQYAGLVSMGERMLEILPKVELEDGIPEAGRGIFLRLLGLARDLKVFSDVNVQHDLRRQPLLEVFIAAFFSEVTQIVRRGLLRRYQSLEEDLSLIRGRFLIERQALANALRKDRLACRFDELTADNLWNRRLITALHVAKPWLVSGVLRQRWAELSSAFVEVSFPSHVPAPVEAVTFDRQSEYYRPAILWANWIIDLLSPSLRTGVNKAPGLVFDMNKLFESAVVSVLRRRANGISNIDVGAQESDRYLTTIDGPLGKQAFGLRPDIVVRQGSKVVAVADTKWTRVSVSNTGHLMPDQSHVYQMQAYASSYRCEHFILIFPRHSGTVGCLATTFRLPSVDGRNPLLSVACVDVNSDSFVANAGAVGPVMAKLLDVGQCS